MGRSSSGRVATFAEQHSFSLAWTILFISAVIISYAWCANGIGFQQPPLASPPHLEITVPPETYVYPPVLSTPQSPVTTPTMIEVHVTAATPAPVEPIVEPIAFVRPNPPPKVERPNPPPGKPRGGNGHASKSHGKKGNPPGHNPKEQHKPRR